LLLFDKTIFASMTKQEILKALNGMNNNTMLEVLNITFTDLDKEAGWVKATMPVTPTVHQPYGFVAWWGHGSFGREFG
jgi:acyl-coenzyme A thioesterase PaaI-like protein